MTKGVRALVAIGLGYVAYRLSAVVLQVGVAIVIGAVVGGCAWALTGWRRGRRR